MGATWDGRNEWSLRPLLGSAARKAAGFRRLVAADGAGDRSRAVQFSEWRDALAALQQLHKVAAAGPSGGLPETPAALISGGGSRSLPLAGASDLSPVPSTKEGGDL